MTRHQPLDVHARVRKAVSEGSVFVMSVFGHGEFSTFSYSIGLTERGYPELFMCGFSTALMASLIDAGAEQIAHLRDGELADQIAQVPLAIRALPEEPTNTEYLIQAQRYYERTVRAFQIVLPDVNGRFPWDPGCDPHYVRAQSRILDLSTRTLNA